MLADKDVMKRKQELREKRDQARSEKSVPDVEIPLSTSVFFISRSLQERKHDFNALTDLEKQQVDFLFYDISDDQSVLEVVETSQGKETNHELELLKEGDTLAELRTEKAGAEIFIYKSDILTLAPGNWVAGNIVDAFAFLFNIREMQIKKQDGDKKRLRRFWFPLSIL